MLSLAHMLLKLYSLVSMVYSTATHAGERMLLSRSSLVHGRHKSDANHTLMDIIAIRSLGRHSIYSVQTTQVSPHHDAFVGFPLVCGVLLQGADGNNSH